MKADTIDITVAVNMGISQETVERCLKVIEWWLNDNPDKRIRGGYRENDESVMPFVIEDKRVM